MNKNATRAKQAVSTPAPTITERPQTDAVRLLSMSARRQLGFSGPHRQRRGHQIAPQRLAETLRRIGSPEALSLTTIERQTAETAAELRRFHLARRR